MSLFLGEVDHWFSIPVASATGLLQRRSWAPNKGQECSLSLLSEQWEVSVPSRHLLFSLFFLFRFSLHDSALLLCLSGFFLVRVAAGSFSAVTCLKTSLLTVTVKRFLLGLAFRWTLLGSHCPLLTLPAAPSVCQGRFVNSQVEGTGVRTIENCPLLPFFFP